MSLLALDFVRRALVAAVLVGATAPAIGTYLVQRRLALLGDGIGHVALTGVALGFLLGVAPLLTAVLAAVVGAVVLELVRARGRASGDVALALLFYGGIAGGVLLIGLAPNATTTSLVGYLFGSVSSVSSGDLLVITGLAVVVLGVVTVFREAFFAVCLDEEAARAAGLPVRALSLLIAATAAVTVVVAMRVVGLLLVSALMVVPVAAAQQLARTFRATLAVAVGLGTAAALGGLVTAMFLDVAPGAVIVLLAVATFAAVLSGRLLLQALRRPA